MQFSGYRIIYNLFNIAVCQRYNNRTKKLEITVLELLEDNKIIQRNYNEIDDLPDISLIEGRWVMETFECSKSVV